MAHKRKHAMLENPDGLSPAAVLKLTQELRIHQIELESQNMELLTSKEKLEKSRAQYFDLFDMVPVMIPIQRRQMYTKTDKPRAN